MNPLQAIPAKARFALYVVYFVGSVVLTYLATKHIVGADEIALWTGLGAVFGVTAASNVDLGDEGEGA